MQPSDFRTNSVVNQQDYQVSQQVENELSRVKSALDSLKVAMEGGSKGILYNASTGKFQTDAGGMWDKPSLFTSRETVAKETLEALETMVKNLEALETKANLLQNGKINEKLDELKKIIQEVGLRQKMEALSEKILYLNPEDKVRLDNLTRVITSFKGEGLASRSPSEAPSLNATAAAALAVEAVAQPVLVKPPFNPTENLYEVLEKFSANPRGTHIEQAEQGLRVVQGGKNLQESFSLLGEFIRKTTFPLKGDLGTWQKLFSTLKEKCAAGWIRNYLSDLDRDNLNDIEKSLDYKLSTNRYSGMYIARGLVALKPEERAQFFEKFEQDLLTNKTPDNLASLVADYKRTHRYSYDTRFPPTDGKKEMLLFLTKHCDLNELSNLIQILTEMPRVSRQEIKEALYERVINTTPQKLTQVWDKISHYVTLQEAVKGWASQPKNKNFNLLSLLEQGDVYILNKFNFFKVVLDSVEQLDLNSAKYALEIIKKYRMGIDANRMDFLETILSKSTFSDRDKLIFSSDFFNKLEYDGSISKIDLSKKTAILKLVAKEYTRPGSFLEALVDEAGALDATNNSSHNLDRIRRIGKTLGFNDDADLEMVLEATNVGEAQNNRVQVVDRQQKAVQEAKAARQKRLAEEAQNQEALSYLKNYGITNFDTTNPDRLFEILKIAAAKDGLGVSQFIKYYKIENPDHLFEIAKIAAAQNGQGVSQNIQNYRTEEQTLTQEQKFEIFALAFRQLGAAFNFLRNYAFENVDSDPWLKLFSHLNLENEADIFTTLRAFASSKGLDFEPVLAAIADEKNPEVKAALLHWIIYTTMCLRSVDEKTLQALESRYSLVKNIFELRQHEMRYTLSDMWGRLSANPDFGARFDALHPPKKIGQKIVQPEKISEKDHPLLANLLLMALEKQGIAPAEIERYSKTLQRPDYTDKVKMNPILEALARLEKEKSLGSAAKGEVLKQLFKDPKMVHKQAQFLQAILECGGAARLREQEPFQTILETIFKEALPLGEVKNFAEKWDKNITGRFRSFPLLAVYAAKLASQPDKELLLKSYAEFLRGVLEGDFQERRYRTANNPHLRTVSSKMDLEAWKVNSEVVLSGATSVEVKASFMDLKKFLIDKILTDHHLDPTKFTFLKEILRGAEAKEVNSQLGEALKGAKDKTDLRLESYLIKLAQGQDPHKTIESLRALLNKMTGVDEFKNDLAGLAQMLATSQKPSEAVFTLVNTDDPCDLFLCGSEVVGSCQRVEGDPQHNKCLLGYCLNGANRLIAVKNSEGKIVARTMLRLLWDVAAKKPVLFQERVYTTSLNPEYEKALLQEAKATAQRLDLPLTSLEGGDDYPGSISALGGPALYEYTDAGGGVKLGGRYTIAGAKLVPLN